MPFFPTSHTVLQLLSLWEDGGGTSSRASPTLNLQSPVTTSSHGAHFIPAPIALDHNSDRLPHIPKITQFYITLCGLVARMVGIPAPTHQWGQAEVQRGEVPQIWTRKSKVSKESVLFPGTRLCRAGVAYVVRVS